VRTPLLLFLPPLEVAITFLTRTHSRGEKGEKKEGEPVFQFFNVVRKP